VDNEKHVVPVSHELLIVELDERIEFSTIRPADANFACQGL
jgi:hypothetical protein